MDKKERLERLVLLNRTKNRAEELCALLDRFGEVSGAAQGSSVCPAKSVWTGVTSLDILLGGALPAGIVEVYGEESVGKTALAAKVISEAQSKDLPVLLVASEVCDEPYLKAAGVSTDRLVVATCRWLSDAAIAVKDFLADNPPCLVVIDSLTALRPKTDVPGRWKWRVLEFLSEVRPFVGLESCLLVVNQARSKVSIDPRRFFAGYTDSAAAKIAEMFDTRLHLSRTDVSEETYSMIVDIVANLNAPPHRVLTLPADKGSGIRVVKDLFNVAAALGVLVKCGHWTFGPVGRSLGRSKAEVVEVLSSSPHWRSTIRNEVLLKAGVA